MSEQAPYPQDRPQDQPYAYPRPTGYQTAAPQAGPVRDHPQTTLAFVLGLLSVLGVTILGPFGWYYGRKVVREIDADPGAYTNRGLAMAGMVLGIVGTAFLAVFAVLAVVGMALAMGAGHMAS